MCTRMHHPPTPEILLRFNIRVLPILGALFIAFVASAQDSACVTVRDAVSRHAIVSALVRVDVPGGARREAWSDAAGRACWSPAAIASARRIEAQALGYRHAWRDRRAGDTLEVSLERAVGPRGSAATSDNVEWRQGQIALAVALALRDVRSCLALDTGSCARSYAANIAAPADMSVADSAASVEARARLRSIGLAFLATVAVRLHSSPDQPPQLLRELSGITLVTFVDVPDSADRYTELRLAIPSAAGRASLGATEMICSATDCNRHRQLSVTWNVDVEGTLAPALAMATDGRSRLVDAFDLSASTVTFATSARSVASSSAPPASPAARPTLLVRGLIRDDKGRAVNAAQILASPGGDETRSDSTGRFTLAVPVDANAAILTARAIGYAPAFHTVVAAGDSGMYWEPRLRSVQQLAERIVRDVGLPPELSSWRYDEMMARRAKGRGSFMIGKEIWSSSAMGDALARVPGVRVKMKFGNTIQSIVMPQCSMQLISEKFTAPEGKIGVWVDGFEQTRTRSAEDVLGELSVIAVIGMEVYRGASEIPGEYTGASYCGVISVWTR